RLCRQVGRAEHGADVRGRDRLHARRRRTDDPAAGPCANGVRLPRGLAHDGGRRLRVALCLDMASARSLSFGGPRWKGQRHRLEVWYATFTDVATGDGY